MYLHDVKQVSLCFVHAFFHLKIEAERKREIGGKNGKQKVS